MQQPVRAQQQIDLGYLVAGAAALVAALALAAATGGWGGLWFLIVPDVALLGGIGVRGLQRGQLRPAAVPLYNALHSVPLPVALGVASVTVLGPVWRVAALAWLAHITVDRALGYGLRTRDGFQRG